MNWKSVRFDWNRARAFLATAELGSLTAAARALGMTQPTLGRQVEAFERELGVVLFERVGRGLELTPSGLELLDHVRAMGAGAAGLALAATGQSQSVEGMIRITASEVYSAFLLPPIIARLRAAHPGIEVEIVACNALVDLSRRDADIAVRNSPTTQQNLIARRLRDDRAGFYAAESYLLAKGEPTRGTAADAHFVGFANTDQLIDGLIGLGLDLTWRNFPVLSDSHLVQWELVKQGAGIGIITQSVGDGEPRVTRVLTDVGPITFPMWLVTHRELHTSKRVRTVFDFLADELSRDGRRAP